MQERDVKGRNFVFVGGSHGMGRAADVDAEVEVWDGQPHAFQGFPFPESELGFEHLGDFIRRCCP